MYIYINFDGTLSYFGPMVFESNKEQKILHRQGYVVAARQYGIYLDMIKEVWAHESITHWTLIKNSEVNNKT